MSEHDYRDYLIDRIILSELNVGAWFQPAQLKIT